MKESIWTRVKAVSRKLIEPRQPVDEETVVKTLYHLEREDIKINIVARFEKGKLIIDGYDIGKTVEEAWGDSDYEYVMTIPARSLPPLYGFFDISRIFLPACSTP